MRLAFNLLLAVLFLAQQPEAAQTRSPQGPTFRSSVEVTTLDVTVVDGDGRPLVDLQPADFTIRIDGKPRRVVRAEWVPLTRPATSPLPTPPPEGYSSNEGAVPGRLIVVAVDQPNIRVDGAAGFQSALNAFIDRLGPADRVAAVALGGGVSTPFTTDRASVKEALTMMRGDMRPLADVGYKNITASEAIDILNGDATTLQNVVRRECERTVTTDPNCPERIANEAQTVASYLELSTERTLLALHDLIGGLRKIEAPKTLILVSEGFAMGSQSTGIAALGSLAAAARTTIYGVRLDDRAGDASLRRGAPLGPSDRQLRMAGLEMLASVSKGGVFEAVASGNSAFQRLERETAGYYLVGVESTFADTDGKAHPIAVQVGRKGSVVRARRELSPIAIAGPNVNPLDTVSAALGSPLITPGVPLQVATYSLRDQDPSKIQVLIHADIGSAYTAPTVLALGYLIADLKGAVVAHRVGDGRLEPPGRLPAPLPYTISVSLAPGDYLLKLAVTEGGRVGSVEHPIHARLIDAGTVKLSELMIGDSTDARELVGPAISTDTAAAGVQGYVEAYGSTADMQMRYEVAASADAPAAASAVVRGRQVAEGRTIFSYTVPVHDLAPGPYVLRATLASGAATGPPLKKLLHVFRVLAPSAEAAANAARTPRPSAAAARPAIVVPVRPFRREDVVQGETLQRFLEIVSPAARQDFEAGVTSLSSGDFVSAELRFKNAQRATAVAGNATAPLTYLAATYAASGHDLEAANVWQTALIDGSGYPEIYEWLADASVRLRNFEQARSILNEAAGKWPGDTRFTERLAALPPPPVDGR